MWNVEVDVVCVGAGAGGLASAIAAVDAGLEVFVTGNRAQELVGVGGAQPERTHAWLEAEVPDPETNEYFSALSSDVGPLRGSARDAEVSLRVVRDQPPVERKRKECVEPFFGARLRDWAARCLVSPYGFIHTRVAGPDTTTMRTRTGEAIEVTVVGSFEPAAGLDARGALIEWLSAQARDRLIDIREDSPLQRIVFEEGEVLGAVFATPDGPFAVRARTGIAVATGLPVDSGVVSGPLPTGNGPIDVCLVSQNASRFGRVELLTRESAANRPTSAYCATNRQLRDSLHEAKQPARLKARRCREVHGYPPNSQ